MAKSNLVLAGVSFPCGVSEIARVGLDHGFQPIYLEHRKFASSITDALEGVAFCEQIPEQLIDKQGLFLPFLESWVSEGAKINANADLRFDINAANVSRSKIALSSCLAQAGQDFVPRRLVKSESSAIEAATDLGYPVVLRNDTGYSGRGVWALNSKAELIAAWALSQQLRDRTDFREMNSVLNRDSSEYVIEPFFESEEWSVDFVVSRKLVLLIRAAEKATVISDSQQSPLCVGYRLISCNKTFLELKESVTSWARAIFDHRSVSFGCFDIRRNSHGKMVALDFAVRLGGDQVPLLLHAASSGRNPYAAAFDAALSHDPSKLITLRKGEAIIHLYLKLNTALEGLNLPPNTKLLSSKKIGYVAAEGSRNRVATVLSRFSTSKEFLAVCAKTDHWVVADSR